MTDTSSEQINYCFFFWCLFFAGSENKRVGVISRSSVVCTCAPLSNLLTALVHGLFLCTLAAD